MPKRPKPSIVFTVRVAVILTCLLPPLRVRLSFVRDERRAYQLVRQCARRVLTLSGIRIQVLHPERMPAEGTAMLVSNHVSIADAAVLVAALPFDVRFVANHVYAEYAILGPIIRAACANIVNRSSWRSRADSGHAMQQALATGRSLLVFPEGTTSDTGELLPFRSGAFRAAARTGRPIVPVAISGTRALMPAKSWLLANAPVTIEVLPPIAASDATRDGISALSEQAATAIRTALASRT